MSQGYLFCSLWVCFLLQEIPGLSQDGILMYVRLQRYEPYIYIYIARKLHFVEIEGQRLHQVTLKPKVLYLNMSLYL
jgi:hypothetical protein